MPKRIPHQLTEHVKLLQKAVLIYDQRALILRRSDLAKSRPGCWDLPGGNCEWPVSQTASVANLHLQDIAREVTEETGLAVQANDFSFDQLVHLSTFFDVDQQIYTMIVGWKLELGQINQQQENQESDLPVNQENDQIKNLLAKQQATQTNRVVQTNLATYPAIELSSEHQAFAWISLADLKLYDFGGDKGGFVVEMIETGLI